MNFKIDKETISSVKSAYHDSYPDGHYFDRDTIKFFKSKLLKQVNLKDMSTGKRPGLYTEGIMLFLDQTCDDWSGKPTYYYAVKSFRYNYNGNELYKLRKCGVKSHGKTTSRDKAFKLFSEIKEMLSKITLAEYDELDLNIH